MKRILLICFFFASVVCQAQTYEALNYSLNATPVNGVNIRTNLPYTNASQMVTLNIEGYNYGAAETISLSAVYYIYNGAFIQHSISSAGGYTPEVWLSNNSGFVNVFINDKSPFQRFKVTAFAKGITEQAAWFQGWTAADEVMQGTNAVNLVYKNKFKGTLTNLGNTLLLGNVGVGTSSPTEKLSVKGKIRAQEVKVEMANWADFVFAKDYMLPTLQETEKHIKEKGHLPGIPSAEEVEKNGIELGDMNKKLLQKIEELTLYVIELNREIEQLKNK
ncbi:hypothetical protein [Pedobacter ginsengisoli]|uniref:hypothetical protein n=1 Tax=Pedobacter ginsengisoli TaxID=363852 RepID=UPI0025511A3E|nr:hypothetical protein [Pedobacter ginsengisoli]